MHFHLLGECQDGKQCCSESSLLSDTDNMLLPTEISENDLNESTLKDLEDITDELLTDLEPEMRDKTDSDLDQCVEMDPDESTVSEDHIQHEDDDDDDDGEREVLADESVRSTQLDCQSEEIEDYLDKSETGLSVDTDEPSETESAQEIIYQRHQVHFTASSDQVVKPSKIQLEEDNEMSTVEDASKKFEDHHDWRFPRTNNFDCCCYDNKSMVNQSNKFDFHNYLGFHPDNTFLIGSSTQVSLSHESGEKKTNEDNASTEKKPDKNEISIMDAIMDNNEWLNVGGPEFKDLPWLTPTAASTDEKQTQWEKEGQVKTGLAKEDEELANKRVATVPPLSQVVNVTFRIHYITFSPSQLVAITGSLQELGAWESFVPLHRAKDGFWANTITLPVESQMEWKFVLVEDGRISRWEECGNRHLFLTSQDEDVYLDKCWGCC